MKTQRLVKRGTKAASKSRKAKVKKNDMVLVTAGKSRGARGKVLRVLPRAASAIVERVNMMKRHTRPNPNRQVQGGVVERESPIRLANLAVVCPECGAPSRLSRSRLESGEPARLCKKCKAVLG